MDTLTPPAIGDDIYIESAFYLSHGVDDRVGGLARVTAVKPGISAGKTVPFVTVAEIPNTSFNWEHLSKLQGKLKEEFGNKRAYPNPDNSPESNEP